MPYNCANRAAGTAPKPLTYWAPAAADGFGQPTFAAPVLLQGYWQDANEMVRTSQGDTVNTHTVVYLTEDVEEEGYLAVGDFTGATPPQAEVTDPRTLSSATVDFGQVKAYYNTPDLRTLGRERRAHLI